MHNPAQGVIKHIQLTLTDAKPIERVWATRLGKDTALLENLPCFSSYQYGDRVQFDPTTHTVTKLLNRQYYSCQMRYAAKDASPSAAEAIWVQLASLLSPHNMFQLEGTVDGLAVVAYPMGHFKDLLTVLEGTKLPLILEQPERLTRLNC